MSERAKISQFITLTECYTALQNELVVNGGTISAMMDTETDGYIPVIITLEDGYLCVRGTNPSFGFGGLFDARGSQVLLQRDYVDQLRRNHTKWRIDSHLPEPVEPCVAPELSQEIIDFKERFAIYLHEVRRDIFSKMHVFLDEDENREGEELNFYFTMPQPQTGDYGLNLNLSMHQTLMKMLNNPENEHEVSIAPNYTPNIEDTFDGNAYAIFHLDDGGHHMPVDSFLEQIDQLYACISDKNLAKRVDEWDVLRKIKPQDWSLADRKIYVDVFITTFASPTLLPEPISPYGIATPLKDPFFYLCVSIFFRNYHKKNDDD